MFRDDDFESFGSLFNESNRKGPLRLSVNFRRSINTESNLTRGQEFCFKSTCKVLSLPDIAKSLKSLSLDLKRFSIDF